MDTEVRLRSGGLGGVPDFTKWQERLAQVQTSYGFPQETNNLNISSNLNSTYSLNSCGSPNKAGLVTALIEVAEHIIPRFLNVPDLCTKSKSNSNQNEISDCMDVKNPLPDHVPYTKFSSGEDSDASETNDRPQELEKAVLDPETHELRTRTWMAAWRTEVENARTLTRLNLLHRALSSDDEDEEEEEQSNSDNNQESSDENDAAPKTKCRNSRSRPSKGDNDSGTFNTKCSVSPANRNSVSSRNIRHDTSCLVCSESVGDLVFCSNCPNVFHLDCHDPPLHHVPRGDGWQCSRCRLKKKRSTIVSYFQSRASRRKTYQALFQKRDISPDEHSEDEFVNSTAFGRLTRGRNRSRKNVSTFDTDDEQQSSETSSTVDTRSNVNQRPISRRRSASRSAIALSLQLNKQAKRRRKHSSDQEDSSSETEQMDEKSQSLCSHILDAICKHKHSWPFRKPVDRSQVPDYYEIITDPIDLSMMREWLSEGRYNTETTREGLMKLVHDLGTMFYNAELYNAADSDVWLAGEQLENFVKNQFALRNTGVTYSRPALGVLVIFGFVQLYCTLFIYTYGYICMLVKVYYIRSCLCGYLYYSNNLSTKLFLFNIFVIHLTESDFGILKVFKFSCEFQK
ncbi:Histone acetyltransferase GCN5 [Schistosoma japonicum]|nr:Histone acetyltransferase GCN5 [Schistosoma japonicum]